MAKDKFKKRWKVRNVSDHAYSHNKERIRIRIDDQNHVTFEVTPENATSPSWGDPAKTGTYDSQTEKITGSFDYNNSPHVYVMTIVDQNGEKNLDCQVDDAPALSSQKEVEPQQAGSWEAIDDGTP